jgi:(R)-benzylsuccinyl-CoA dehydrogenase
VSATEAITRPSTGGAALSEDLHGLRDLVREFVRRELLPLEQIVQEREAARGLGNDPVIPPEDHARLTRRARELDLWGLDIPPELGGQGLGVLAKMVATEEINRSIVPFRLPPESTSISFLIEGCTPEQRECFVLPYTRDGKRMALALSEPNAGADAAAIETTAARADGGWLLNGAKTFISWADEADLVIVMALTDREKRSRGGITAFLVEAGTPGMHVGRHIPTMGHHTPNEMSFTDCFVPDGQVLGEVGYGFTPLAQCLNVIRVDVGARALGMAERLIDMMVEHANTRVTFGQKLADRQAVQWMIADSVMEVHAARLMVHDAAAKLDAGVKDVRTEASSVKVFATEMISRVVDRAMQVYGGMGYTRDLPIEFIYRNSRIMRIMDGPSEIHRQQIARLRLRRAPVR